MNSLTRCAFFVMGALSAMATLARADVFSLASLGAVPPGTLEVQPNGISPDGAVVVGTITTSATITESFRWTSGGGFVGLGDLPGGDSASSGLAVSAGGSVVVGSASTSIGTEAYRWTSAESMVGLGYISPPPSGGHGSAKAVSADGSVIVGVSSPGTEAYRWTSADGMVGLGTLGGAVNFSDATGVSADGAVVVGTSYGASGTEAFRWTADDGMVGLGDLPGGIFSSSALAVSADGHVIVGRRATATANNEAFRWTTDDGMVGLGHLPNALASSIAYATSADGGVIVGDSATLSGETAFLWTAGAGMVDLQEYLISKGVTGLDQWILTLRYGGFGRRPHDRRLGPERPQLRRLDRDHPRALDVRHGRLRGAGATIDRVASRGSNRGRAPRCATYRAGCAPRLSTDRWERSASLEMESRAGRTELSLAVANPGAHAALFATEFPPTFTRLLRAHTRLRQGFPVQIGRQRDGAPASWPVAAADRAARTRPRGASTPAVSRGI